MAGRGRGVAARGVAAEGASVRLRSCVDAHLRAGACVVDSGVRFHSFWSGGKRRGSGYRPDRRPEEPRLSLVADVLLDLDDRPTSFLMATCEAVLSMDLRRARDLVRQGLDLHGDGQMGASLLLWAALVAQLDHENEDAFVCYEGAARSRLGPLRRSGLGASLLLAARLGDERRMHDAMDTLMDDDPLPVRRAFAAVLETNRQRLGRDVTDRAETAILTCREAFVHEVLMCSNVG